MAASRKNITSPRGNIEPRGYPVDPIEARRSSTACLGPSSSRQLKNETKKPPRVDRRNSCPGEVSAPDLVESPSTIPYSTPTSSSQTYLPVFAPVDPDLSKLAPLPPFNSHFSSTMASSPSQLTMAATQPIPPPSSIPAPPSAVLLRDLVRERAPSPAKPTPISPNISPTHSRQASLSSTGALKAAMPPIREDPKSTIISTPGSSFSSSSSSTTNLTLADRRRSSHLSHLAAVAAAGPGASSASLPLVSAPGPGQGRRASYYQYGEDYITRYDRVGMAASPAPSGSARTSLVYGDGVHSTSRGHLGTSSRAGSRATVLGVAAWDSSSGWGDVLRDVERAGSERSGSGSGSGSEMTEKVILKRDREAERRDRWFSWRRVLAFILAVLVLAGIAVGIAFGVR